MPLVKIIGQVHHHAGDGLPPAHHDGLPPAQVITVEPEAEKGDIEKGNSKDSSVVDIPGLAHEDFVEIEEIAKPASVRKAFWWSTVIIICIAVLVPIPLGASNYVFSPGFFTAWMVVAMVSSSSSLLPETLLKIPSPDLVVLCWL